ncbi:putative F-box protein [Canna indica]|uniref:F-box protein n=1 Tax=Canna indica TaxID=4628 RepID=A0AAQ3JVL0_9LILI|nr:putative F-box protein [Canna indica]
MPPSQRRITPLDQAAPPWEVVELLSQFLDPKTLAAASCVSKSWYAAFSSDHLWKPICHSAFPSSRHLTTSVSPRHLFLLLHTASRRRRRTPSPPILSLRRLLFMVDVFQRGAPVLSLAKAGEELVPLHDVFRFDVPVAGGGAVGSGEETRVVWTVATMECREAFVLMNCVGEFEGKSVGRDELWFSEKLPCSASCCCSASPTDVEAYRLEAQVFMELSDHGAGEGKRVAKVCFGMMNCRAWRYIKVEEGLLYLQSVLLPFMKE